jgi:electron transfer flavoprotein beta subunit
VNVLVCVKRVPATGGRIVLTEDERRIDAKFLGFTVSPHEECAVEEAVRLIEANGGTSTVLTLGPPEAEEQLRDALALGIDRAVLLETDGEEWDPQATAAAIVDAVTAQREAGTDLDLLLFGNEAADTGDFQVAIRVAHALGLPCVVGAKVLEIREGGALVRREAEGGWEEFEVPLPAVVSVKEGINLPRYPSVPGRIKAKKKPLERNSPTAGTNRLEMLRLKVPEGGDKQVTILGDGPDAAPKVAELLRFIGVA